MNYDLSKIRIKCNEIRNLWVLKKRGLYYRPKACGYTDNINEAWLISEAEADKHTYPHDEPVTKHLAMLPVEESADAALQLAAWMAKPENGAYLWFADSVTNLPKYTVSFISRKNATQATADTFPLALCLAFLKANGINPEAL